MGETWKESGRIRLIEIDPIHDIYADGIGAVELLGSCVRVILYTEQGAPAERERVVVAKIVRQIATIDRDHLERMISEAMMRTQAGDDAALN